jgi:hypothetical protein
MARFYTTGNKMATRLVFGHLLYLLVRMLYKADV